MKKNLIIIVSLIASLMLSTSAAVDSNGGERILKVAQNLRFPQSLPSSPAPLYPPIIAPPQPVSPPTNPPPPSPKPVIPSKNAPESGITNPRTGEFYPGTFGGVTNPRTGVFLPKVEGGYLNPETGEVIPKQ